MFQAYGELRYQLVVANQGAGPAVDVEVHVFHDHDGKPDCWEVDFVNATWELKSLPDMSPGDEIPVEFVWPWPEEGAHASWFALDCWGLVGESNDNNNIAGPIATNFDPNVMGVDLEVTDIKAIVECDTVTYQATVENIGDVDAPPFRLDFFYDEIESPEPGWEPDYTKMVEGGLKAGDTVSVQHVWEGATKGTMQSWVVVDGAEQVTETAYVDGPNLAEDNNVTGCEAVIGGDDCACDPDAPITGQCKCGAVVATSGWCCADSWQEGECVVEPEPPPADADARDAPPETSPPDQSAGGPGNSGGSGTPGANRGNGPFGAPSGAWEDMTSRENGGAPPEVFHGDPGCSAGGPSNAGAVGIVLLLLIAMREVHRET